MSQYRTGTVAVTNGSNSVVGTGTAFLANVTVGSLFSVSGSGVPYIVGAVVDDTHLTLSSNYAGSTESGQSYACTTSFTTNLQLPYPEAQDIDTATILKRAMVKIDTVLGAALGATGNANRLVYTDASGNLKTKSTLTFNESSDAAAFPGAVTATGMLTLQRTDGNYLAQFSNDQGANNEYLALYKTASDFIFTSNKNGAGARCGIAITTTGGDSTIDDDLYIDANGNTGIGGSPIAADIQLSVDGGATNGAYFKNADAAATYAPMAAWNAVGTGDARFAHFYTEVGASLRGTIDYNRAGGLVRYNTSSDGDLKNILGDADPTISEAILRSTRMRSYAWKDDPTQKPQIGPIAQELVLTFKGAVSEGRVVTRYDGLLFAQKVRQPWAVDRTAFVNHLVVGWQLHDRDIAAIKAHLGLN